MLTKLKTTQFERVCGQTHVKWGKRGREGGGVPRTKPKPKRKTKTKTKTNIECMREGGKRERKGYHKNIMCERGKRGRKREGKGYHKNMNTKRKGC